MQLFIRPMASLDARPFEIVERKGRGHPDTLCDAIAEEVSLHLARHALDRFGTILHHNVDKVLLCAGTARPAFGGGVLEEPIEIVLGGRATMEHAGEPIPVHDIAVGAARGRLRRDVPELDIDRDVRITSRIRPGSADLRALFARGAGDPLSNDTSIGVGFAPPSELEQVVLAVEAALSSDAIRAGHPAIGPDVKVMGARLEHAMALTIGCAMIGRHLRGRDDYLAACETVRALALEAAGTLTDRALEVAVNAGDDVERGEMYLTVTGTSAEAGDDGEVGRGNRVGGLITPGRPMTIEAAAGKNPVSHVGKIYSVLAGSIAEALVAELDEAEGAECTLVSRIGTPVRAPWLVEVALQAPAIERARGDVERIVTRELDRLDEVREAILDHRARLF